MWRKLSKRWMKINNFGGTYKMINGLVDRLLGMNYGGYRLFCSKILMGNSSRRIAEERSQEDTDTLVDAVLNELKKRKDDSSSDTGDEDTGDNTDNGGESDEDIDKIVDEIKGDIGGDDTEEDGEKSDNEISEESNNSDEENIDNSGESNEELPNDSDKEDDSNKEDVEPDKDAIIDKIIDKMNGSNSEDNDDTNDNKDTEDTEDTENTENNSEENNTQDEDDTNTSEEPEEESKEEPKEDIKDEKPEDANSDGKIDDQDKEQAVKETTDEVDELNKELKRLKKLEIPASKILDILSSIFETINVLVQSKPPAKSRKRSAKIYAFGVRKLVITKPEWFFGRKMSSRSARMLLSAIMNVGMRMVDMNGVERRGSLVTGKEVLSDRALPQDVRKILYKILDMTLRNYKDAKISRGTEHIAVLKDMENEVDTKLLPYISNKLGLSDKDVEFYSYDNKYVMTEAQGDEHDEKQYYYILNALGYHPFYVVIGFKWFKYNGSEMMRAGYSVFDGKPNPLSRLVF